MSKTIRRVALLAVLVLLVAGAAGASATDSRAGTKLTGCRNTSTGTLDQVRGGPLPMGGVCGAGEVQVTWNKRGPQGPQGPTGAPGATGAPGVSGYDIVVGTSANDSANSKFAYAGCPAGKKAVGGGGATSLVGSHITASTPGIGGDGWGVLAYESPATSANWILSAYAICVTALP